MMNYKCHFCGKDCADRDEADMVLDWWHCLPCQAFYEVYYNGELCKMYLDITVNKQQYGFQFLYEHQESRIVMYPYNPEDTVMIVVSFPYLLRGVTPQNVFDKVQTYITFS